MATPLGLMLETLDLFNLDLINLELNLELNLEPT